MQSRTSNDDEMMFSFITQIIIFLLFPSEIFFYFIISDCESSQTIQHTIRKESCSLLLILFQLVLFEYISSV